MKVKFDLNLSAWLRNIEIEANSYEEAEQEIYKMPLEDLLELCYIDTTHINDLTAEIVEKEYQVKVYDIEYRFENNDLEPEEVHKLRNRVPSTLTLKVGGLENRNLASLFIIIADFLNLKSDGT